MLSNNYTVYLVQAEQSLISDLSGWSLYNKVMKKAARKVAVGLLGFPVILVGIALLVLPGPGLLVILVGLIIISWEFDWAERYVAKIRTQLNKVSDVARSRKNDQDTKNK